MKTQIKTLAAIFILIVFISSVNGQTEKTKIDENIFGVVAGGTLSNISNYDGSSRVGFLGGLYWEWRFSEKFSLMPNILYTERGAEGIKLSYFSWPIVLKYNISDKFAIAAGIAWDDLLSVKADSLGKDDFRKDDWRIPITAGYNFTDHLSVGIGYSFGLTDITKNDNETWSNNWAHLSLAYKIF